MSELAPHWIIQVDQWGKEIIPTLVKSEDRRREHCRLDQRQNDGKEFAYLAAAIHRRRLVAFGGDLFEPCQQISIGGPKGGLSPHETRSGNKKARDRTTPRLWELPLLLEVT
jgi:hypothetical protein